MVPYITGVGYNLERSQKIEECIVKSDNRTLSFNNSGEHIVDEQMQRSPVKKDKGIKEPLMD